MVVRFEGALERSARCDKAEEIAAALTARCEQLATDLSDAETETAAFLPRVWMMQAETEQATRRLALRNVDRVPAWASGQVAAIQSRLDRFDPGNRTVNRDPRSPSPLPKSRRPPSCRTNDETTFNPRPPAEAGSKPTGNPAPSSETDNE